MPLFAPAMVARPSSFSPSAEKPARAVADWQALGLDLAVHAPSPASEDDLLRAHDRAYVRDVLALRAPNGFGDRSAGVARSLPWTSGAMLSAARHAIAHARSRARRARASITPASRTAAGSARSTA